MKTVIWFILLVSILLPGLSIADTHPAASCSQANVQAAVNASSTGDVVSVPVGTCTWTAAISVNKGITIQGAGIGSTIITAGTDGAYLFYYTAPGVTTFRITGFTIDLNSLGRIFYASYSGTTPTNIRIDYNNFLNCRVYTSVINGTFQGVIDHNSFTGYPHFDNYGIGGGGQASWNGTTFTPGSLHNVYYENNTFTHSSVTGVHAFVTGGHGGRYAYRYNDFVVSTSQNMSPNFDAHGNQTGGVYGTMGMEVYGNRTTCTQNINVKWFDQRGGRGMYFYNDMVTTGNVYSEVRDDYADTTSLTAHTCPGTAEYMYPGTSTCASNGEPQHPSRTYYWNNLKNNATLINPYGSNGLTQNVHFWVQESGSIECGTPANLPSTCTTGEAYWATNQSCSSTTGMVGKNPTNPISGTLYRCASTNNWEAYFTPYQYPHPLISGGSPEDVTPPTITITGPTSNPTYETTSSPLTLSGTGSDNVGVTSVIWANDRGGSGNCSGTTSWTCSNIPLKNMVNVITVTAYDAASNQGTDSISITYYFTPSQYIEAESGVLSSPMVIGSDAGASGGQYVYTPTSNSGYVGFVFNIATTANYKLSSRTNTNNDPSRNLFYVGLDSEPAQGNSAYSYDIPLVSGYAWSDVNRRGGGSIPTDNPKIWNLTQGLHTFYFYGEEANTWLDEILLTPTSGGYSVSVAMGQSSGLYQSGINAPNPSNWGFGPTAQLVTAGSRSLSQTSAITTITYSPPVYSRDLFLQDVGSYMGASVKRTPTQTSFSQNSQYASGPNTSLLNSSRSLLSSSSFQNSAYFPSTISTSLTMNQNSGYSLGQNNYFAEDPHLNPVSGITMLASVSIPAVPSTSFSFAARAFQQQSGVWYGPDKDPVATLDYLINWQPWLRGDTINSSTWATTQGLTIASSSHTPFWTTIWLSGGTPGNVYTVTNTIETAGGRKRSMSFRLRISWQ